MMNKGYLQFIALVWGVALIVLIPLTYLRTLRNLLPLKKGRTISLLKGLQQGELWGDGYPLSCKYPVLAFQLDTGEQKVFRVSWKVYRSFQGGETGTLSYKENNKRTFYIGFSRD